jgi:hypothetical protein
LAEEKEQIRPPFRAKEALAFARGKGHFQRPEDKAEE